MTNYETVCILMLKLIALDIHCIYENNGKFVISSVSMIVQYRKECLQSAQSVQ